MTHHDNAKNMLFRNNGNNFTPSNYNKFKMHIGNLPPDKINSYSGANVTNSTLLHYACEFGNLDAIDILLGYGADDNMIDAFGKRPIDIAMQNNNKDAITLFRKKDIIARDHKIFRLEEEVGVYKELYNEEKRGTKRLRSEVDDLTHENRTIKRKKDDLAKECETYKTRYNNLKKTISK